MATPIARIYVVGAGRACCWQVRFTSTKIAILKAPDSDMNFSVALQNIAHAEEQGDEIDMWASVIGDVCFTAFYCGEFPIDPNMLQLLVDESDLISISKELINALPF